MSETGILYVVATPLGNLDDISPRAIQVLRSVDLIFAEDTRHSKKLLNHIGSDRPLLSLFEHNESQRKEKVLQTLGEGQAAIISDAGTPAVSDPGARAVAAAHQAGFKVVPIPGPSALSTALSAAGFSFSAENGGALFLGFLPTKGSERTRILDEIEQNPGVIVLFESPHRITKTLAELALRQPEREAVLARELTKI
ncbi:16S rRNA (cytidine(1402)-2'-O)-methyltransferase, partial [Myxococcota bacterium]|nr:16S rRNA (cytidine(1402)-2'-O)-methyltransferase [Myxococcota bacterium]